MKNAIALTVGISLLIVGCHHRIPQDVLNALSEGAVIEDVRIAGNRRIPPEIIKSNLQTKPGDHLRMTVIRTDIQKLYTLGYFDNVGVSEESGPGGGKIVTFDIKEKL